MSIKVLVFESDTAFAAELRTELGNLGCTTTIVDDGNLGLQTAANAKPDLILLSIELPRMNGFSVCNKLKKDPSLKDVPLIIMSGESSDETFEQHRKLRTRAEDYVHKPIAFGELLQHIQALVPLAHLPSGEGEAGIVIDDEIEIGNTDYVIDDESLAPAPASSSSGASLSSRGGEKIDADMDAFAESAFGRLTELDSVPPPAPESRAGSRNGAGESVPAPTSSTSRRTPIAPLPLRGPSSRPPTTVDIVEYERVRAELVHARERTSEIDRELQQLRTEAEKVRLEAGEAVRLSREVDELRAKLASGAKTGGTSSREFLDLREALNRKDREILTLKETLSRKDKEFVELHDRQLSFERTKTDLEDRLLSLERELGETKESSELLAADTEAAKKASEEARARLEKLRTEGEVKERQLGEIRARHFNELAARDERLATIRAELDQTLANERAEHARALDVSERGRTADVERAKREHDAALSAMRQQVEQESRDALGVQTERLEREHEARLGELHQAHEAALSDAAKEAREKAAAALAEAEKQSRAVLDALRVEHAAQTRVLENDRDARIAAAESKATRELGEAHDKLAKLDMDLSATRGELAELRQAKDAKDALNASAIADLDRRLAEMQAARDDSEKRVTGATERVAALEAELGTANQDLRETKEKLLAQSARAEKAQTKWDADRQSLERAKDALAVALAQVEEAENRSFD